MLLLLKTLVETDKPLEKNLLAKKKIGTMQKIEKEDDLNLIFLHKKNHFCNV